MFTWKKTNKKKKNNKKNTFVECNSNQNLPGGSDLATLWLVYEALSNYHTMSLTTLNNELWSHVTWD